MTRLHLRVRAVALVAALAGSSTMPVVVAAPAEAASAAVLIQNFAYSPSTITIAVGSSITWTNRDSVDHTVTEVSGPAGFDSGQIAPGATYTHTFTVAGTYTYHCADHSMMPTATVRVGSASPPPKPSPKPSPRPTVRPTQHTSSAPAPRPTVHTTSASAPPVAAGAPSKAPTSTPSVSTSMSEMPGMTPSPTTSGIPTVPTSGTTNGSSTGTVWWIAGVVILVAGGTGAVLMRRGRPVP